MSFNKVVQLFLPKDKVFYPLFEEVSDNLELMAQLLVDGVEQQNVERRISVFKEIEQLESQNDRVTHQIFTELANHFITPFDREDIQALAVNLDDIADYINVTAKKLSLFEFHELNGDVSKLSKLIQQSVLELSTAIKHLKEKSSPEKVKACCIRINDLENEADDIYERAVAVLFKVESDPKRIMVLKEVMESQEIATDKCEDVANIIESVLIKYS